MPSKLALFIGALLVLAVLTDAHANLIADPGFEVSSSQATGQLTWPLSDIGSWGVGDPFSIVTSENGVAPAEGSKMLRFDGVQVAGDVYQIVDLSTSAASIDTGLVTVTFSAYFNATASNMVGINVFGWDSAPTAFDTPTRSLITSQVTTNLDTDLQTWEQVTGSTALPVGLRYIALGIHADGDVFNTYADLTSLSLTTARVASPPSFMLLALGLATIGYRRRKQSKVA